ncbi:NlpC/P60 family protein [Streptomyces sp. DH12]|uniref:C40 family peptidase n=1 Tax=Streptomyces sp. DH12 TaxID=2857010 RepID=UPI001E32A4EE|nr:C40 family peptidase [Streptomyces sp. DH12]
MAAHRKPRQRPLGGRAGRRAATLALAGAATATAFEGAGHAAPAPGPAPARAGAEADRLYREAEAATERYNGARERADAARDRLAALQDEAARHTERLNAARDALGATAAAQYRGGGLGPAMRLAFSSDPERHLRGAALAERIGDRQSVAVAALRGRLVAIGRLRAEAADHARELRVREAQAQRHKATVQNRLAAARLLLSRLTAEQRAAYEAAAHAGGGFGSAGRAARTAPDRRPAADSLRAPTTRAARAVAYAYGAIGRPYRWGATGPASYDCSGLTQAAWRAAGVSLPRTTYSQIDAGRRVPRAGLAPGDLVFFHPGLSHVGIYIGDGRMIHAPRTGSTVRIAPVDSMPWAGATRVG